MEYVSISVLRELFHVTESGQLVWLKSRSGRRSPDGHAGFVKSDGYREVTVDGRKIPAHHITFALAHGRWPVSHIDHINRDRADNRPCNLREATVSQNQHNRGMEVRNTSGFKGVSWCKRVKKWHAQIALNRKAFNLGYFDDPEAASRAYGAAALKLHGEFARPN